MAGFLYINTILSKKKRSRAFFIRARYFFVIHKDPDLKKAQTLFLSYNFDIQRKLGVADRQHYYSPLYNLST